MSPDLFALYAATDAYMTYKLYLWQLDQFNLSDNSKLKKLFIDIEMPVVKVAADMELTGVVIDDEYSEILSEKYHKQLDKLDTKIDTELSKYDEVVNSWRTTSKATEKHYKLKDNKLLDNQVYKDNPNIS